jgi:hypothetical protein
MSAINDHSEAASRNVICCLLALEIAKYDARPVFDQIRATQDFRKLLSDATAHAGSDDLISIVREDGALLSFLADPEECFTTALTIREAAATQDCYRDLPLRIGINLGTVEIAEDEFGHTYVSGEGRRDADRVMRHGPPRQISVARPFFEVLSRAAPTLSGLLEYQGVYTDTLGPPLGLYRVPPPQSVRSNHLLGPVATTAIAAAAIDPVVEPRSVTPAETAEVPVKGSHWLRPAWLRNSLLPLLIGVVVLTSLSRSRVEVAPAGQAAVPQQVALAAAISSSVPLAVEGTVGSPAAASKDPADASRALPALSTLGKPTDRSMRQSERRPPVASKRLAASAMPVAQKPKESGGQARSEPAARTATLLLAIKPWGEVYVDGKKVGITPPLKRFEVAPGRRQITITNSILPSYQFEAMLDPDQQITVMHDFSCVSHREKACRDEFGKGLELRPRVIVLSGESQR